VVYVVFDGVEDGGMDFHDEGYGGDNYPTEGSAWAQLSDIE
jgi:hypothetical protein